MIEFVCESIDFQLDNKINISEWIERSIVSEGFSLGEITYVFCNDNFLLSINQKHLNHDTYTDIITFDYVSNKVVSSDIFISVDRVQENAQKFQTTFNTELNRVMIHGILHLVGYKDKSPEDQAEMRAKEDKYLNLRAF